MLDLRAKETALNNIILYGICAINPPIFGWLLETGVLEVGGFNKQKARELLDELLKGEEQNEQ